MTFTAALILALLSLLLGILGATVFWRLRHADQERTAAYERRIDELEKRAAVMDKAALRGRKHHAYNDLEAIDGTIGLLVHDAVEDKMQFEARSARRETAIGIMQRLREGPNGK